MNKKTVRDVDVQGKRVFLRADLNVPLDDGRITDDTRIRASLPTIVYLLEHGASVVLASHLGRPKGKVNDALRLKPVADRLSQLLGRPMRMTGDALGPGVVTAVDKLRPGDLLLLENLRFHAEEEANDPDFAKSLSEMADVYVDDAFGIGASGARLDRGDHRTTCRPWRACSWSARSARCRACWPSRPSHSTPSSAVPRSRASWRCSSPCWAAARPSWSAAGWPTPSWRRAAWRSARAWSSPTSWRTHLDRGRGPAQAVRFMLPTDVVVAAQVHPRSQRQVVAVGDVPKDWYVVDIGPQTLAAYTEHLARAKTIFWNGPMGIFEIAPFAEGTNAMARFLAERSAKRW